jgi:hypothetical protein
MFKQMKKTDDGISYEKFAAKTVLRNTVVIGAKLTGN